MMSNEILSLHLDPTVTSRPFPPITGIKGGVALDFDYKDNIIFFSQVKDKKLSKVNMAATAKGIEDFAANSNASGEVCLL